MGRVNKTDGIRDDSWADISGTDVTMTQTFTHMSSYLSGLLSLQHGDRRVDGLRANS